MSKKIMKELSSILGTKSDDAEQAVDTAVADRLSAVVEQHLDVIAAAHHSIHRSYIN